MCLHLSCFSPFNHNVKTSEDEGSSGHAQPLRSHVRTPHGLRTIGSLRLGEDLSSPDGEPSQVKGIYPQGVQKVYRVTLANGKSTRVTESHLWRARCMGMQAIQSTDQLSILLQGDKPVYLPVMRD